MKDIIVFQMKKEAEMSKKIKKMTTFAATRDGLDTPWSVRVLSPEGIDLSSPRIGRMIRIGAAGGDETFIFVPGKGDWFTVKSGVDVDDYSGCEVFAKGFLYNLNTFLTVIKADSGDFTVKEYSRDHKSSHLVRYRYGMRVVDKEEDDGGGYW